MIKKANGIVDDTPNQTGLVELLRSMNLGGPVISGLIIIAVFFGGFMGWAAFAPLGSAAIAPGTVIVETNRKTVQHLEGGIVDQIKVRDGDTGSDGGASKRCESRPARETQEKDILCHQRLGATE